MVEVLFSILKTEFVLLFVCNLFLLYFSPELGVWFCFCFFALNKPLCQGREIQNIVVCTVVVLHITHFKFINKHENHNKTIKMCIVVRCLNTKTLQTKILMKIFTKKNNKIKTELNKYKNEMTYICTPKSTEIAQRSAVFLISDFTMCSDYARPHLCLCCSRLCVNIVVVCILYIHSAFQSNLNYFKDSNAIAPHNSVEISFWS